jgi:hypothetical protein
LGTSVFPFTIAFGSTPLAFLFIAFSQDFVEVVTINSVTSEISDVIDVGERFLNVFGLLEGFRPRGPPTPWWNEKDCFLDAIYFFMEGVVVVFVEKRPRV